MGRSITARLLTGTIAVVALVGVAWCIALVGTGMLRASYVHTVGTVDTLTSVVQEDIKLHDDEETGVRGYLLARQPEFLQPYTAARLALPSLRRTMTLLLADQPDARVPATEQVSDAGAWERWAQSILRQPPGSGGLARSVPQQRMGKVLFDRYRAATARVLDVLNRDRQTALQRGLADVSGLDALLSLIFIATIGLGVLLGWQSGRAVIRPLRALGQTARAIGSGDLTDPVAVAGAREFVRLGESMEWMRLQLATTEERLRTTIEQKQELLRAVESSREALRSNEERLRAVIANAPIILFALDRDGVFTLSEGQPLHKLDFVPGQVVGLSMYDAFGAYPDIIASTNRALAGETVGYVSHVAGGVWDNRLTPFHDKAGEVSGIIGVTIDITERTRAEEALHANESRLRALIEQAPVGACVIDADGIFETVNPAYAAICGYAPDELIGQSCALVAPDLPDPWAAAGPETEATTGCQREMSIVTKDGLSKTILSGTVGLTGSDGRPRQASFVVDITERKQVERRMERMAHYDTLTDLPNRALFGDRLSQALLTMARDPAPLALLLIDLDRFKEVNDTLGHDAGDLLLRQVATRMRDIVRAVDTVARLGGDEFAVLLPHTDEDGAIAVAHKLLTALTTPILLQERAVEVGGSIGIALHLPMRTDSRPASLDGPAPVQPAAAGPDPGPTDGADGTAAALLRQADVAMYQAKQARSGYVVYRAEQDEHSPTRLTRAAELRRAIAEDQLRLYYQPVVDVSSGRPSWAEALVRWQHPDHGLLGPDGFIPLAEETGLITPLTRWVLDEALRQCVEWERQGLALGVAVNLSRHSLTHGGLPSMVADRLEYHDVMPERLTLEMTEGSVMTDPERARATLMSLAALGVRLAIDDFGTGYSSLGVLKTLPVHVLKTDKSFAQQLDGDAANTPDASIMGFIAALGRTLNLTVVAEGVETRGVWETLSRLGCGEAQGYYLCRPLPGSDLAAWSRAHQDTAPAASLSA